MRRVVGWVVGGVMWVGVVVVMIGMRVVVTVLSIEVGGVVGVVVSVVVGGVTGMRVRGVTGCGGREWWQARCWHWC